MSDIVWDKASDALLVSPFQCLLEAFIGCVGSFLATFLSASEANGSIINWPMGIEEPGADRSRMWVSCFFGCESVQKRESTCESELGWKGKEEEECRIPERGVTAGSVSFAQANTRSAKQGLSAYLGVAGSLRVHQAYISGSHRKGSKMHGAIRSIRKNHGGDSSMHALTHSLPHSLNSLSINLSTSPDPQLPSSFLD